MGSETHAESKGWFQTLPGILTGLAAIVTALGALYGSLASVKKEPSNEAKSPVAVASFPCSKASTQIEKLICRNPTLASLDTSLDFVFHHLKDRLARSNQDLLVREQAAWRRGRDACENYTDMIGCVEREYQSRIAALRDYARGGMEDVSRSVTDESSSPDYQTLPRTSPTPVQPSFPCSTATREVEKSICTDTGLARLDLALSNAYESIWNRSSALQKKRLKRQQAAWLRQRDACENSDRVTNCLDDVYRNRLSELAGQ